jgi:hypothetical protein
VIDAGVKYSIGEIIGFSSAYSFLTKPRIFYTSFEGIQSNVKPFKRVCGYGNFQAQEYFYEDKRENFTAMV